MAYSAHMETNEGTFIAIARVIAAHPFDLAWWPEWDFGLPFQNTYLPGLHILVAAFSLLTGHAPGLAYHQVSGAFYVLGPVSVYFMAWGMSRQAGVSAFAALAFSLLSPSAWLMPLVLGDIGGPLNLRRLQILAYYGEGPHNASLFFFPLAVLFLYLSVTQRKPWMNVAAAACLGLAVLMNAFAAVILGLAALAILTVNPAKRAWRTATLIAVLALLAYLWISPLVPPSVVADIRHNSPRTSGEYPFNTVSAIGAGGVAIAYFALLRIGKSRLPAPTLIFFLYALCTSSIVLLAYYFNCNLFPQPLRYCVSTDLGLCLAGAFGGAALLNKLPHRRREITAAIAAVLILLAAAQTRHQVRYARKVIHNVDPAATAPYRLAKWMEAHMNGDRVFIGSQYSFHFNAFTDLPQFHGGHDPMQPSMLPIVGVFIVYSGMNAGPRDTEICVAWLQALGAHAIAVPGPISDPYYRAFTHPRKFEGRLPVLWRESDTTVYAVPSRSHSLAHVVPATALVQHFPVNGLDTAEMEKYVKAMEDPSLPEAPFQWLNRHSAKIEAQLKPGEAISIQERNMTGWHARANGLPIKIETDGLGFMVLKPNCRACTVHLTYDGGLQWPVTLAASALATLLGVLTLAIPWLKRQR